MGCAASTPCHVTSAEIPRGETEPRRREHVEESVGEFHQDFLLNRKLGAGAFGVVFSACRAGSFEEVAVKIIDSRLADPSGKGGRRLDRKRQRAVENEVDILQSLPQSPCIVKFHRFYQGEGLAYMVMEKCTTALQPFLESLPVLTKAVLKPVFQDMLTGIAACHAMGIVHRDVKCDNFLVARSGGAKGFVLKLCDFGLAGRVSASGPGELFGNCGTPPYMAPEIVNGKMYGAKVDVWAMGVLAYVLLFGIWPYMPTTLSSTAMKDAIRCGSPAPAFRGKYSPPDDGGCSATSWVRELLCRDASSRPSAEWALNHASLQAKWDVAAPMAAVLRAAAKFGAFEPPAKPSDARKDLDETLARMNAKHHAIAISEISTAASVVSPARPR